VTYLTQGKVFHEDFKGHKGEIEEGDIQWMTAGRGIVHAEMPYSFTQPTSGFQLWINLSKDNKMMEPQYQEIKKDKFPIYKDPYNKFSVKIVAGRYEDLEGPCNSTTPTSFYDVSLEANSEVVFFIEQNNSGFVFLFEGESINVNDTTLKKLNAIRLDTDNQTNSQGKANLKFTSGNFKTRFLLIFARPLNEPISKYGPFVMNTKNEIIQAFEDYQMAKNGFENRLNWESEIQYMVSQKNKRDL
jgi:redox-sensitive bicupin YhaK (pirin superfamily)